MNLHNDVHMSNLRKFADIPKREYLYLSRNVNTAFCKLGESIVKVDVKREFEFDNNQDVFASPSMSIGRVRDFAAK